MFLADFSISYNVLRKSFSLDVRQTGSRGWETRMQGARATDLMVLPRELSAAMLRGGLLPLLASGFTNR